MAQLEWSKLSPLDLSIISNIGSKPGVYRLAYKASDGSFYVFYVGRADKSIKEELTKFASKETDNPCVKTHLENLECYFRHAFIEDQKTRQNVERTVYDHFKPKCNLETPNGESIDINFK